jgi:hypothetical protein
MPVTFQSERYTQSERVAIYVTVCVKLLAWSALLGFFAVLAAHLLF